MKYETFLAEQAEASAGVSEKEANIMAVTMKDAISAKNYLEEKQGTDFAVLVNNDVFFADREQAIDAYASSIRTLNATAGALFVRGEDAHANMLRNFITDIAAPSESESNEAAVAAGAK